MNKPIIQYKDVNEVRASGSHCGGNIYIDKRLKGTRFEKLIMDHELLHYKDYLQAKNIQNKVEKSSLFIQWVVYIGLLIYRIIKSFLVDTKTSIDMTFRKREIWNELFKRYPTPQCLRDFSPICKSEGSWHLRPFLFMTYLLFILIIIGEVYLLNWIM